MFVGDLLGAGHIGSTCQCLRSFVTYIPLGYGLSHAVEQDIEGPQMLGVTLGRKSRLSEGKQVQHYIVYTV